MAEPGPMDWFASTGIFGWLITGVTLVLTTAGIVAVAVRVRRITAFVLLMVCALPLLIGVAGMFVEMRSSHAVIESRTAPTPEDLTGGTSQSLILGALGMLVCDAMATVAILRSLPPHAPRPE